MSFDAQKILDSDIAANGVQSQPNKLTGSALENKKVFDKLIDAVVQEKFNALIDELTASTAGAQLGIESSVSLPYDNVQDALDYIVTALVGIVAGDVPDGSITTAKLADTSVTNAKLSGILPDYVGIKTGTTVPTTADISNGEIYLKYTEPEEE